MIRLRPRGQYAPLATAAAALLLAVFVLAPAFAAEPKLQHAKPADVGMDPAGLKKLNEAMHGMVDGGQLAGVVTMVSRKGKVVHFDAYGKRAIKVAKEDGPDGMPITEDADHPMTMRELMSHTAGLTYGLFSQSQVDTLYVNANVLDFNQTLKDMIDKLAKIPLRQQPGSLWS